LPDTSCNFQTEGFIDACNVNERADASAPTASNYNVRKRIAHPELKAENIKKRKKDHGQEYTTKSKIHGTVLVLAKKPQHVNCSKCRYKCSENFPEDSRQTLCSDYYKLGDYTRQKDYVVNHVIEIVPKKQVVDTLKHRKVARAFYIDFNGERHRVCRNFFVRLLI